MTGAGSAQLGAGEARKRTAAMLKLTDHEAPWQDGAARRFVTISLPHTFRVPRQADSCSERRRSASPESRRFKANPLLFASAPDPLERFRVNFELLASPGRPLTHIEVLFLWIHARRLCGKRRGSDRQAQTSIGLISPAITRLRSMTRPGGCSRKAPIRQTPSKPGAAGFCR
jgi:hypothetical protein